MNDRYLRFEPTESRKDSSALGSLSESNYASILPVSFSGSPSMQNGYACILAYGGGGNSGLQRTPVTISDSNLDRLAKRVAGQLLDNKRFGKISVHGLVTKLLENPQFPTSSTFSKKDYGLTTDDFLDFSHVLAEKLSTQYAVTEEEPIPDGVIVPFKNVVSEREAS